MGFQARFGSHWQAPLIGVEREQQRLVAERGCIVKWSGGVVMRGGFHVGAVAWYQDGQHFARRATVPHSHEPLIVNLRERTFLMGGD